MTKLLALARQIEAKHALFLFDSCFSGTIFKTRALPEEPPFISELTTKPVRQFITAGDAGQTVPAKSIFAPALKDAIQYGLADLNKDAYITGSELGMFLQEVVTNSSLGNQTPQYGKINDYALARGDFVFHSPAAQAVYTIRNPPTLKASETLDKKMQLANIPTSPESKMTSESKRINNPRVTASESEISRYQAALSLSKKKRWQEALDRFNSLIQDFPDGELAPNALFEVGRIALRRSPKDYEPAIKAFTKVTEEHPSSSKAEFAEYQLAVIDNKLGECERAKSKLSALSRSGDNQGLKILAKSYLALNIDC